LLAQKAFQRYAADVHCVSTLNVPLDDCSCEG
jgi:hypothetical protein